MQKNKSDPAMLLLDGKTRPEEVFTLSQWEEEELRSFVNNKILRRLTYEMLPKRYEAVAEAHPKTFGWALQDSSSSELSSEKLTTWLQSDFGLYWISGKPGSGKSTLMKHILDDERTKEYLEQWARQNGESGARLIVASFFFWNSGALEQRSQMGMLRWLLFQVLEQEPELLPIVLPSLWIMQYRAYLTVGPGAAWTEALTLGMLMTAFKRLTAQQEIPCKLFFLIGGLDEFEGDQELLAELFNDISKSRLPNTKSSVKLCVSSRPYVVFQENFQGYPMLKLQELTVHDITQFVSDRFLGNGAFKKLAAREPQSTTQLIDAVVSKADGVFLWVFIVVKDPLKGIRNRELEPLYLRIMSQIDSVYLIWASKTFQLIRAAREVVPQGFSLVHQDFLTIAELYFALSEDRDSSAMKRMTQTELDIICREAEYHIAARCACLLEVTNEPKMSKG
ncbi:hypothetical protein BKA61DRAFT_732939 [Leptodontidium sp. MPI-SDFR-AT-0119]|nr:hypothetical protein BKA61DRAFT_732939 [Leptodontidium sp. MPI-SDFR-AT-0119]